VTTLWWCLVAAVAACVLLWVAVIGLFVVAGRREDARALARFIPDCLVLVTRLVRDPRVPRRRKLLLAFLAGYLAMPFDLIPDFIPVAGQLDDVVVVVLTLRLVLRGGGEAVVRDLWPGPESSLRIVLRALSPTPRGLSVF
jgi:uncharacterized membrane protein YkvA (DUF1232 family)